MIIDTHAHLNDEIYTDLQQIVDKMHQDNLEKIVCGCADKKGCIKAMQLIESYKNIYATLGLHPDEVESLDDEMEKFLISSAKHPKVVGIGEIGLDYHENLVDKQVQIDAFIRQLTIAHKCKLPILIHVRDAFDDLLKILKSHKDLITNGGVIHCFSGSLEIAQECIKLGFSIAFGGVLTFKNAKKLVEVAQNIPLDKMVVETDSPYLCPEPFRGNRNEPKYINYVVQKLADLRQISKEKMEKVLLENTYKVFPKLKN